MTSENTRRRRDLAEAAVLLALAVFLHTGALAVRTQERLAEKVVRLHVLADSDDPGDQALKLRVRDAVLERAGVLLENAYSRTDAEELLREHLPELETLAASVIAQSGGTDSVSAELCETEFPTRTYDGLKFPAGRYLALRIIIGTGAGGNWWCVVFPSLCRTSETVTRTDTDAKSGEEGEETDITVRTDVIVRTDRATVPETERATVPDSQVDRETVSATDRETVQVKRETIPESQAERVELVNETFSAEEIRLITGEDRRTVVKFRTVELWGNIRRTLFGAGKGLFGTGTRGKDA